MHKNIVLDLRLSSLYFIHIIINFNWRGVQINTLVLSCFEYDFNEHVIINIIANAFILQS